MSPALLAIVWLPLAAPPQQPPLLFESIVADVADSLDSLRAEVRYVSLLLGKRGGDWMEDVQHYATRAHMFVLWQDTNNSVYLDAYKLLKRDRASQMEIRALRDGIDKLSVERERLQREAEAAVRKAEAGLRKAEAQRRMKP